MDLPEITEVKRLGLRPGDSLAVRLDREPSEYEAHEVAERVRAITGVPVVVLGPSMDIEVISPPLVQTQPPSFVRPQVIC